MKTSIANTLAKECRSSSQFAWLDFSVRVYSLRRTSSTCRPDLSIGPHSIRGHAIRTRYAFQFIHACAFLPQRSLSTLSGHDRA